MEQLWQEIKSEFQRSLPKGQFDLWVSTIEFSGVEADRLVLGCRNRFHIEWLRDRLEKQMLPVVKKHLPEVRRFEYRILTDPPKSPPDEILEVPFQASFDDLVRRPSPPFNPRFTFDQFVVGNSNQLAYAASMGVANSQQFFNQSLYLLSDSGLGKSHLSHAVGNYLLAQNPNVTVQYVTTEQFANEMIFALKNGSIEAFKNRFRNSCDVLLMERVEFLSGKEKLQDEVVYTLDELMDRGKKVICTGNLYPKDIPKLSNELQSRLSGFLVASIDRPDFETRVAIIRKKIRSENIHLPGDVIEFLADRVTSDIRQLESCIIGIVAKTNLMGVPVSLDLAQEVTRTMLDYLPKISVQHIQRVVSESFQISLEELHSKSRRKEVAVARKIAMYLCRHYTSQSLAAIGHSFNRSHSSVLYAVNALSKEMKQQGSRLKRQVEYVMRRLETTCLSTSKRGA